MRNNIVVAGYADVDIIKTTEGFPQPHGLNTVKAINYALGGAACNVGFDLARMDKNLPVKIYGAAGADGDGDKVVNAFREYPNIDVSKIRRRGRNAFTDVLTENDTRARTFLTFGGADATFGMDDVNVDAMEADIFHIGYILLLPSLDAPDAEYGTKMAKMLKSIQEKGVLTSVDVVSETGDRYPKLVPPSLKYTDFLIVNEIEAGKTVGMSLRGDDDRLKTGEVMKALRRLKEMGVRRWAVIHTPEGGWGIDENGNEYGKESLKLPEGYIQGTVGAGDAFCAGVLYAAYSEKPLSEALFWGNVSAACSLSKPGGSEGIAPMAEMLKRFEEKTLDQK